MRKVTYQICEAFQNHTKRRIGNSYTDGKSLYLHGNEIARWKDDGLYITNAGWRSNTTKERLNGLRGVNISQKNWTWYLNGKEWDGKWIRVADLFQDGSIEKQEQEESAAGLRRIATVMAMGDLLGKNQKESNDWKTRMLKAGLEGRGLIMPEDWDKLDEDTKQARLNGAIGALK